MLGRGSGCFGSGGGFVGTAGASAGGGLRSWAWLGCRVRVRLQSGSVPITHELVPCTLWRRHSTADENSAAALQRAVGLARESVRLVRGLGG